MKQLLFLLLFPSLAFAQYQGNANQKITLGEQTTADGLVWRGLRADTTSKIVPYSDTSAYIILDTVEKTLWLYKAGQVPKWQQVGGSSGVSVSSFSAGTTGLTPSTATTGAVTLGGTLAVANGGTGASVRIFVDTINTQTVNGAKTFTSAVTATRFNPTSTTATGTGMYLPATNTLGFSTNGVERVRIKSDGNVGYGTNNPVSLLHIEKAGGTTFAFGDQFRVSSGTSGNRAEFHLTDNVTSDAFISFLPSSTPSSRYLEITTNGAGGGISVDGNGRLGIGTTSPVANLQINSGTTTPTMAFSQSFSNTSAQRGGFSFYNSNNSTVASITAQAVTDNVGTDLEFYTRPVGGSLTKNMVILNNGNIGIGTASPAVQFHTTGGVRFAGLASITDLRTDADGDLFNGSDFNLKNSIDTINFGLSDVLKLKPVSFNWNDESRNISEYKSMGFIAQDVMDVIPNAVSSMGDGDMQVDYNAIVATLTKAIQEQQALIKALEQRILILENK